MRLSFDQIKNKIDYKKKLVHVDEWGGDVEVRTMSVKQQMELSKYNDNEELVLVIVSMCCINEDGSQLFSGPDDLRDKSPSSVIKLYDEIISLNKQKDSDIDDLAKNS